MERQENATNSKNINGHVTHEDANQNLAAVNLNLDLIVYIE